VRWENPFFTTTTTLAWGSRCRGVRRYRDNRDGLSDGEADGDKGITEVDWAMGSIYLKDPRADRTHLII